MALSLPKKMYAWRKHKGSDQPVWEEVDVPKAPANGFLCRMLASGVCHSDHNLLVNENQRPWFQDKYILGHEGCGEIVEVGAGVVGTEFSEGDTVSLFAVPGCGQDTCAECSRDLSQLCQVGHHSGIGQDGFFAPFAAIDIRGAVKVPDGVSPAQAAVATDAVTTAYHAVNRRAEVKATETVFLFGLGGLGFNALQIIRSIGARVIVSDPRQERLDAAASIGVPLTDMVPIGTDVQDYVKHNQLIIDTTIDFAGTAQTLDDAQNIVRIAGKIVCIGTLNTENTIHMKLGIRKRLTILFSYGGQVQDLKQVLEMIAHGKIVPSVEERELEAFPTVLNLLHEGKIPGRVALMHRQS